MPWVKRRIWFLRQDERAAEEKKMRIANHIELCKWFTEELYHALLTLSPENAEELINHLSKQIYWAEE